MLYSINSKKNYDNIAHTGSGVILCLSGRWKAISGCLDGWSSLVIGLLGAPLVKIMTITCAVGVGGGAESNSVASKWTPTFDIQV